MGNSWISLHYVDESGFEDRLQECLYSFLREVVKSDLISTTVNDL